METTTLTDTQDHVLAQISAGFTIRAAASSAGVHRNTIAYWMHTSPDFHQAFEEAETTRALLKRSEAEERLDAAYAAIDRILANPNAPTGLTLRAAIAVIDRAAAPLPHHPAPKPQPPTVAIPPEPPEPASQNPPPAPTVPQYNPRPITRVAPAKPGRNDVCTWGSGRKFKRCCLGKVPAPAPLKPPTTA